MSLELLDADGNVHTVVKEFLDEPDYRDMLREKGVVLPESMRVDSDDSSSTPRAGRSEIASGLTYTQGGTPVVLTRQALEGHIQKSHVMGDDVVNVQTGRAGLYVPPALRGSTVKAALREVDRKETAAKKAKIPKKLFLSGVLRDAGLQQKYGISDVDLAVIGAISSSSLEMAATKATEVVQRKHKNTTVVCDMVEVSKARVRASIKTAYHEAVLPSPHREISMSYYPGTNIVSMMPDTGVVDDDCVYSWELTCPMSEWTTAGMIWELINAKGPYVVAEQFGNDYSLLRILVTIIDRDTGVAHVLRPGEQQHAGTFNTAWDALGVSELSDIEELNGMDLGVVPVVVDEERVGTVYKVDTDWALTTGHVLKTPDAEVGGGSSFTGGNVKRLSSTLMAVQTGSDSDACAGDVVIRPPQVGESVHARMVLLGSGEKPRVKVSPSAKVAEASDLCFVPGLVTHPGMSGCVYVADSDGAVVAVHEGTKAQVSVGASMVQDVRAACTARESWYSGRMPGLGCVQSPTVKTWADSNSSAYAAWVKLAGSMVVGYGGSVEYHPRQIDLFGGEPLSPTELTTRPPVMGEKCVIVAIDSSGVYMSHELHYGGMQAMCAPTSNSQWWALMRKGSVVVAVDDASIVASVWAVTDSAVAAERWVVTPESLDTRANKNFVPSSTRVLNSLERVASGPRVTDNREWLQRVFPFLNSHVYDGDDIDECFTHQSYSQYLLSGNPFVGNRLLAKVGRTVMTARLSLKLRSRVDVLDEIDEFAAKWQTDRVKTIVAEQFQMLSQLRVSQSYKMDIIADSALMLEAMVGLVYLYENDTVLDKFIGSVAMFGDL